MIKPSESPLNNKADNLSIDEMFYIAVDLHKNGQAKSALCNYLEILDIDPNYLPAIQNTTILAIQQNDFSLAEKVIEKGLPELGFEENLLFNYAVCKLKLGKIDESIEILNEIVRIIPDSKAANGLLARITLPGDDYLVYLSRFHQWLKPKTYLEIGVNAGNSLVLANPFTQSIGIDPSPIVSQSLNDNTHIYACKSEDFFLQYNVRQLLSGRSIEMAFIDGMHTFDAALKDFINVEKHVSDKSTVLIHDCIPLNKATSSRIRSTTFWSGDVWKIVPCLKKYRPDLLINTIPTPPTGLCVINNLNPESNVLEENFDAIVNEFLLMNYEQIEKTKQESLNISKGNWEDIKKLLIQ